MPLTHRLIETLLKLEFSTSWAVGSFRKGHFFNTSFYMVSAKENGEI